MSRTRLLTLLAGTILASTPALADTSAPAAIASAEVASTSVTSTDSNAVVNIVVTAQRRSQKIQSVPIAITALGGTKLLDDAVLTANDVARFVPNLTGANGGGRVARPRYFLRGVGVNDPSGNVVSPTGIYVDDVYLGDTAYETFPLFDIDRIEVLRGPQGTLWGKNTIGGAINTISRKPTFDTDGYWRIELGNYDSKSFQGAVGGALIDHVLAARLAVDYEDRGGYYKNSFDGSTRGASRDEAARLQFLYKPNEDVDAVLNIHSRDLRDEGPPSYKIGTGTGGADSYGYIPAYGTTPHLGDAVDNDFDAPPATLDSSGANLNVNWNFSGLTLTSITSFDSLKRTSQGDGDNGPRPAQLSYSSVSSRQFTQEVRLSSDAEKPFYWTVGGHYFNEGFQSDTATGTLANVAASAPFVAIKSAFQNTIFNQSTESYAIFGEATYKFTDRFKVAAGARWTSEEKAINLGGVQAVTGSTVFTNTNLWWLRSSVSSPLSVNATQVADNTWGRATYSLTPQYEFTDHIRGYLRYATGFRSGGYNGNVTSQVAVNTVSPETLTDIEAGLKSEWFDNRLIANASAFTYDYRNIQVNVQGQLNGQSATTLRNAANGKIDGFELELTAKPVSGLTIRANAGLLTKAVYTNFVTQVLVNNVQTTVDVSGNQIARAPKTTATLDAEYSIPLASGNSIVAGADLDYRSHIFFNAVTQNDPLQEQAGYTLANARLSYRVASKRLSLALYVNNLTDKSYVHNANAARNGAYPVSFGSPRTIGVNLTHTF